MSQQGKICQTNKASFMLRTNRLVRDQLDMNVLANTQHIHILERSVDGNCSPCTGQLRLFRALSRTAALLAIEGAFNNVTMVADKNALEDQKISLVLQSIRMFSIRSDCLSRTTNIRIPHGEVLSQKVHFQRNFLQIVFVNIQYLLGKLVVRTDCVGVTRTFCTISDELQRKFSLEELLPKDLLVYLHIILFLIFKTTILQ